MKLPTALGYPVALAIFVPLVALVQPVVLAKSATETSRTAEAILGDSSLLQDGMELYVAEIVLKSDDALTYFNLGLQKHYKLNDFQGALADYDRAIALKPDYAEAYNSRGILKHYKLNNRQGALLDYDRAITLKPDYAFAYNNRGLLKYERKNRQGALLDYNRAIILQPDYANAYYNRGLLKKHQLNDTQGAITDFRQAAKLDRQNGKGQYLQDSINQLRSLGATE